MAWPSGSKASNQYTDNPTDRIADARAEINQNITNVNAIIDYYGPDGGYDVVGTYNKQQLADLQTLTAGSTINWDLDDNQVAYVQLNADATLANPTNQQAGATYILIMKQDGGTVRTISFGSAYKFPAGNALTLTPATNAVDILTFISDGTNMYGGFVQDLK
jgi:hypothetical protein